MAAVFFIIFHRFPYDALEYLVAEEESLTAPECLRTPICYTFLMMTVSRMKAFIFRNERHISLVACIIGFALDLTTLPGIDHPLTQVVCISYFATVASLLLLLQKTPEQYVRTRIVMSFIIQFCYGGLLSTIFVYYFRSSSLLVSWPLVILLGILLAGNEIWQKRFARLDFQVTILFILFLFYAIFTVPLVFGEISTRMFLVSVAFTLSMLGGYIFILSGVALKELQKSAIKLVFSLCATAAVFVTCYFMNIIPPIPLVTRIDGVYHSVTRDSEGGYLGVSERLTWREEYLSYWNPVVYHRTQNEPVYFYSAVYAPAELTTPITHLWQYFDEAKGEWTDAGKIEFPIRGGRAGGYRGYSQKDFAPAGLWRVTVQTSDGRVLSRKKFSIIDTELPPESGTVKLK